MNSKAKFYIERLQLKKHPEGGYYREVYRSGELIFTEGLPRRYSSKRVFSTSIYYLLEGKQHSSFHKLKSDELWHFYDGASILIYILSGKGELKIVRLGNNIADNDHYQVTVEKNNWFAAELADKKSFALIGCTVAPGFEFDDFIPAGKEELSKKFPKYSRLISRLSIK